MVEILKGVIEKMKPLMEYLSCFKPLDKLMNDGGTLPGCANRVTKISLVNFPEEVSERTKAMEIQTLEEADTGTVSVRKSLVLTEDGVLLLWTAVYDRPLNQKHGGFTGGRDEVTKESKFEIFTEKMQRDAFSHNFMWKVDWREVFFKIIYRLHNEMRVCIEKREQYLQSMKYAYEDLSGIICRIER